MNVARAIEFESAEVYRAKERPGYACWTVLWRGVDDSVYLVFAEKRRAPNPLWEPIPPAFWESMGLPLHYQTSFCNGSKDVITEMVVHKSTDEGASWLEIGRSPSKVINDFSWASLADGGIIRVISDDYVAFDPDVAPKVQAEVSGDGGNSWQVRSVILEGFNGYPYRLKRTRDGALVMLLPYQASFGPTRTRISRHTVRPHAALELHCGVFVSTDEGHTWADPLTALPGSTCWEPDFVELPNGDLLFVNSSVQGGPQRRQVFHKTPHGFVPGAVFEVISGRAPECLVYTRDDLLVGSVRGPDKPGGDYVCSNDLGATWHIIEETERCLYQPYMVELNDGRLLCTWHVGGDNFFGEMDQWVGSHTFRLHANLPKPTRLVLTRDYDDREQRYINRYTATLTAGGEPVAGQAVRFSYHLRWTADFDADPDPREAGTHVDAITDEVGRAVIDLSDLQDSTNIHQAYRLAAQYVPEDTDMQLPTAKSDIYYAYFMTMTDRELNG